MRFVPHDFRTLIQPEERKLDQPKIPREHPVLRTLHLFDRDLRAGPEPEFVGFRSLEFHRFSVFVGRPAWSYSKTSTLIEGSP